METAIRINRDEGILAECSDDEEFNKLGLSDVNSWCPHPDVAISLYEKIAQNSLVEFNWKCTARRSSDEDSIDNSYSPGNIPKLEQSEPEVTFFDFEEESTPKFSRFGKSSALKGGGKKKTTSLEGILSNMERHRIMDQKASKQLERAPPGLTFMQSEINNTSCNNTETSDDPSK